jgi:hypothetical protein
VRERERFGSWLGKLFAICRPRVGVCVVRAESQPSGLLVTVTVNRDVVAEHSEPPRYFSDTGEATDAVADFLESFTRRVGGK